MCGGFVGDILDTVTGAVESVGNAITGAVDSVIHNPVGLIVDVGLLSMGVPPIWAGAAAGAANAAANHGNILQGALTGGAMSWAAGTAGDFAYGQGLDPVLGAAASGANSDITSISGLTTSLTVAQGGTGGANASTARTNLGAAASGANSDITSISGLTTALTVAQGGTGGANAATAFASALGYANGNAATAFASALGYTNTNVGIKSTSRKV